MSADDEMADATVPKKWHSMLSSMLLEEGRERKRAYYTILI